MTAGASLDDLCDLSPTLYVSILHYFLDPKANRHDLNTPVDAHSAAYFVVLRLSKADCRGGDVCLKQVFLVREQRNCRRRQIMNAEKWEEVSQDFQNQTRIQRNFTCDDVGFLLFVPHVVSSIVIQ